MFINGYRCMWVLAMFDLPTDTMSVVVTVYGRKNWPRMNTDFCDPLLLLQQSNPPKSFFICVYPCLSVAFPFSFFSVVNSYELF